MTVEIALFLILFVVALVLFTFEWVSSDVTALGLMLSLILLGLLKPADAFAGFGSDTVMMILGLLIMTESLIHTGLVDMIGRWMLNLIGGSPARVRGLLLIAPAIMSSFISNTASAAFFLPIALGLANRARISPSKLLMPMSFAAILAGSVTLVGTSTNVVVSGLMQQHNLEPMGMFELTPVGLPILISGILYMAFIGHRLIRDRKAKNQQSEDDRLEANLYFTEIIIPPNSALIGKSIEESPLMSELRLGMMELQRQDATLNPRAELILEARDTLLVEGGRQDMLRLQQTPGIEIAGKIEELEDYIRDGTASIAEVVILPGSPLLGRTIKGLGLRERYRIQILAVNQAGEIRYSRIGRLTLHLGDVLLIKIPHDNLRILENERMFRVLDIIQTPPQDTRRAILASLIFIGAMFLAITEILSIAVAVLLGALAVFLTKCIKPEETYRNIEWKTLILIGSMLAFGRAMQETGTANYLADIIVQLPINGSPHILLGIFFILAMILTQPMSNQAAAAILVPIAIQSALQLGYNPRPFALMIALAASCSFITPLEPASVIVYSAGRYKFKDFIRVGGLLTIVVFVIALLLVPMIWPLKV